MKPINQRIAEELGVHERQVTAAVELLDGGATVPFIARYRKEATGTLDDAQLRLLEERLGYLRELEDRRKAVLESIAEQGKLDDALRAQIEAADTKARLEDIYLPYKPKRRSKALIAREAGLGPLADATARRSVARPERARRRLRRRRQGRRRRAGRARRRPRHSGRALLRGRRTHRLAARGFWTQGRLVSKLREENKDKAAKFADYFDFGEPFTKLPSHRVLAMFRGEKEEALDLRFEAEQESPRRRGRGRRASTSGASRRASPSPTRGGPATAG
jgi:uncharacterized protein